jgi:hypothetical protein
VQRIESNFEFARHRLFFCAHLAPFSNQVRKWFHPGENRSLT